VTRPEVVFTPEAEEQLAELYRYIEENATAAVALSYTSAVVEYCEGLATFRCVGRRATMCVPVFVLPRTSGAQRLLIPLMMREFRSLVSFMVVATTRPHYNQMNRKIDTTSVGTVGVPEFEASHEGDFRCSEARCLDGAVARSTTHGIRTRPSRRSQTSDGSSLEKKAGAIRPFASLC
jgi:toxin ParE1/3/4